MMLLRVFLILFVFVGCTSAVEVLADSVPDKPLAILVPDSGAYSREISTDNVQAQAFFDQGLRFAWGFYFPESIASYQEAARLDPDHPMPYWGMAHAMGPNPNSRYARMPDDPQGEGLKAIKKALERIDMASPLEAKLIRAMSVLYDKETIPNQDARDQAYLISMRELNKEFPDDPDIAALYAASYMSIGRWDYWDSKGNPKSETMPVAEALEYIIHRDRSHPGVLHLHIHLLEASFEPERALVSAEALEKTMPIAGHVVHMPAHIYVRVGLYQKAIESNLRSLEADARFQLIWSDNPLPMVGTYHLSHRLHPGHATDFLRYAGTLQGNFEIAISNAFQLATSITKESVALGQGQKRIAAPWLVLKIFGKWDDLLNHEPAYQGTPYLDGIWAYSLGSAYLAKGNMKEAEKELERLKAIATAPNADEYRVGATPSSAVLKLASYGLEGEFLMASGDLTGAIEAFRAGVAIEDQNNYTEPPDWAQPMRHYLGAALLLAGQAEQAESVYRRDLRWNQNNGWSLFGLGQALIAQDKKREAAEVLEAWQKAWAFADIELSSSHL